MKTAKEYRELWDRLNKEELERGHGHHWLLGATEQVLKNTLEDMERLESELEKREG